MGDRVADPQSAARRLNTPSCGEHAWLNAVNKAISKWNMTPAPQRFAGHIIIFRLVSATQSIMRFEFFEDEIVHYGGWYEEEDF